MEVALDNCVASAGVMLAKKAGRAATAVSEINQVAGCRVSTTFKVCVIHYPLPQLLRLPISKCDSQGMTTSRSCIQMVLSYFAFRGCAWKLHLYLLYPENPAICCCEQTKWQPPSVQLQPFVQVDVTQFSVVVWKTLLVPSVASMFAPS